MKKLFGILSLAVGLTVVSGSINNVQAQNHDEAQKSKKGKYTAIGAGAGAATGVAVSRKNRKGAIIGGAVGAGSGYLYGKRKDRKNGRKDD